MNKPYIEEVLYDHHTAVVSAFYSQMELTRNILLAQ
jgi:hypothetical protein